MKTFAARMGLVCALLGAVLGCRSPQPPPPEFEAAPKEGEYIIGPADHLRIDVWQNEKLTLAEVPVRPDGKVTVPLIDDVQAAGLTPDELKTSITEKLSEYIQNPTVTVVVLAPLSKRAYVLGEVRSPGPISLGAEMSVLDALTAAGGFTPFAKKSSVRVLRRIDGKELDYTFDYDAFVAGRAPGTNVLLHPGDTVLVP
jgi:polysaccharide export outer membrane protein